MAATRLLRLHAASGAAASGVTDPLDGASAPGLVLPAGAAAAWNGLELPRCLFGDAFEFRELPGVVAAPAGEDEPVREAFRVGGESYTVEDPLADARLGDDRDDPPPAFAALEDRIDATLDFARERFDRGRLRDAAAGEGRLPRGRLLDTDALIDVWQSSFDPAVAPRRLVVRLAEALEDTLRDLARRPRRVLRRRREMQPVATVQQVDAACLRWISRQPGRTVAEKAGSRQEVLGVVRREEHNTLENRVARDVMLRCRAMARAYLKAYERLGGDRVERVARFERTLRSALASGVFSEVSSLPPVVQPNYALLEEPRYARVWSAWVQLRSGRRHRDALFRWRRRLVAESAWLATASALSRFGEPAYRSDARVFDTPRHGGMIERSASWVGRRLPGEALLELAPPGDLGVDSPGDATLCLQRGASTRAVQLLASTAHPRTAGIGSLHWRPVRGFLAGTPPEPLPLSANPQRETDALEAHIAAWIRS